MNVQPRPPGLKPDVEAVLAAGRPSLLRRLLWPLLLAVVLAAAAAYYLTAGNGTAQAVRYVTEPVRRGDITVLVTATGTVEPTNKVEISSELSGIIRTVKVEHNSTVKAGDILAELDTDKLEAAVASSRAKLSAAEARVAEARATLAERQDELTRKQQLAERRIIAAQEFDTARAAFARAEAALASAEADIEATRADLKLHETDLRKTCICSPINGVVLSRNVEVGQVVAASLQAPVLFTIAEDLARMEVHVDVDEADVGKVREGHSASFTVDAFPEQRFDASIRQLRFGSEIVQGVVTYKAVLTTDNSDLLLRPGMTATAEIRVREEKSVLSVPNAALRFSPPVAETRDERSLLEKILPRPPRMRRSARQPTVVGQRQVWVLRAGQPVAVPVTTGASDGGRTQIEPGALDEGDAVIVDVATTARRGS